MFKKTFIFMFAIGLVGGTSILFQNFVIPSSRVLTNPPSYHQTKKCSVYAFAVGRSPVKIAEVKNKDVVNSISKCGDYVKRYYGLLSSAAVGCGFSTPIFTGLENDKVRVVGVLENLDTKKTEFNSVGTFSVKFPFTSFIAGSPTSCNTRKFYFPIDCRYDQKKFCVQKNAPLLNQSSKDLAAFISAKTKNKNITKDKGWCSPVATSISLAGAIYSSEFEYHTDSFLWLKNLPTSSTIDRADVNKRTRQFGEMIYGVGNLMETNWEKGGTYTGMGLRNVYKQLDPTLRNLNPDLLSGSLAREFFTLTDKDFNLNNVIEKVKSGSHVMVLSTQRYKQICSHTKKQIASDPKEPKVKKYQVIYNCRQDNLYKPLSVSHAVSVNGVEDGYLKIYDPWGRIYNVRLETRHKAPGIPAKATLITHVTGEEGGFIQSNKTPPTRILKDGPGYLINASIESNASRIVNVGSINGFMARPIITVKPKESLKKNK